MELSLNNGDQQWLHKVWWQKWINSASEFFFVPKESDDSQNMFQTIPRTSSIQKKYKQKNVENRIKGIVCNAFAESFVSSRSGFRSNFKLFSTLPDHRLLCSVHLCIANKRTWCLLGVCEDALAGEVSMIWEAKMVWLVAVSFFALALAPPWGAELPRRTPRHKANRRAFTAFPGQRHKRWRRQRIRPRM